MPTNVDARLVSDALGGDRAAQRQLADRLLDTIQREVVFVLRRRASPVGRDPRQEARDLVHDVLVALFERDAQELRRWDPERGRSLDSFVCLVARRRVARVLGQRRGNPWSDNPTEPGILAQSLESNDASLTGRLESREQLQRVLDALLGQMSDRDVELFELIFVEERDPAEVAEAMDMTRGAVNAWSYRTRKLARQVAATTLDEGKGGDG